MTEFTLHIDLQNIPSDTSKAKEKLDQMTGNTSNSKSTGNETSANLMKIAKGVGVVKLAQTTVKTATSYANYKLSTVGARYRRYSKTK